MKFLRWKIFRMKIDKETKTKINTIKLKNYKEFEDIVNSTQEQEIK